MSSRTLKPLPATGAFAREFEHAISPVLGVGALLVFSANGYCESQQQAGAPPSAPSAHIDFRIVIPQMLGLNMDTGTVVTNARAAETALVTVEQDGARSASASRADRVSTSSSSDEPVSYTVAVP
jgi:hypothetical protein